MRILSNTDFAQITLKSLIADYDNETLINLYQPIVGMTAIGVYFTLVSEAKNQKVYSATRHDELLMKMQIATSEFVEARKKLEAVGLLQTFYMKENDTVIYSYLIFSPKTPNDFFGNALLYGMLIKCVGESTAKKIKLLYPDQGQNNYGEDISSKFTDVFHPEFDSQEFAIALSNTGETKGRNALKIKGDFSYEEFFNALKEISQITSECFLKKEVKEIERLATLYGIDEKTAAAHVATLYDGSMKKGERVDMAALNKAFQREGEYLYRRAPKQTTESNLNKGTTDLAKKINLMETLPPKKYLSVLQNGTKPANADLNIVESISRNYGLSNGVINAIVDYSLAVCNNRLSLAFVEKIAATMARQGITTAIDAMNYLLDSKKNMKKTYTTTRSSRKPINEDINEVETSKENIEVNNTNSDVDDESWESLLDQLDQGGSDGKA